MSPDRSKSVWVYVGGKVGDRPDVVAYSLETAMVRVLSFYTVPGTREDIGYPERWVCSFVSDEDHNLQWTLDYESNGDSHKTYHLYIEKYEIEEDEWDETTGWRR